MDEDIISGFGHVNICRRHCRYIDYFQRYPSDDINREGDDHFRDGSRQSFR